MTMNHLPGLKILAQLGNGLDHQPRLPQPFDDEDQQSMEQFSRRRAHTREPFFEPYGHYADHGRLTLSHAEAPFHRSGGNRGNIDLPCK